MALIPSFWLPINRERPSQLVYLLLYVLVFVPAMIIPLYTLQISIKRLMFFDVALLISFVCLRIIYRFPLLVIPRIRISPFLFWLGFILVTTIFYAYIINTYGFQFHWISFNDVYEVRSKYASELSENGVLSNYVIDWISNVLNPFLIVFGLIKRKFILVIMGILGQVMMYSITGNRTAILSGIYVFLIILSQRKKGRNFGIYLVLGLTGIVVVSCLIDSLTQTNWATSLFVRRLIITPGLLTGYYLQFFSEHPNTLLAHSIFKGIFPYPYPLNPPNLIGYIYWGNPNTSANANVWADAYANFGIWGVFGFTVLLGLVLWIFDSLASGKNIFVTTLVLSMPSLALVDGALLTALLNHGLGFAILLIYLLPKKITEVNLQQEYQEKGGGHRIGEEKSGSP